MIFRRHRIAAALVFSGIASLSRAAPLALSESQLDHVAAGAVFRNLTDFSNTGAVAFATTHAVSTPAGTAVVDAHVTTQVGLGSSGFISTVQAGVIH